MFWLRNKKNNFWLHTLIWGSETSIIVFGNNSLIINDAEETGNSRVPGIILVAISKWHFEIQPAYLANVYIRGSVKNN